MDRCKKCGDWFRSEKLELSPVHLAFFCKKCWKQQEEEDEFALLVKQIYGIREPTHMLWSQYQNFMGKYGCSHKDILDTMKYLYFVEKIDPTRITLGLIPNSISRAKDYYRRLGLRKRLVEKSMESWSHDAIPRPRIRDIEGTKGRVELLDPKLILGEEGGGQLIDIE